MKRKILSVLLVAVMLLGVIPFSAFAGELLGNEPAECVPLPFAGQGGTDEITDDYILIDENCYLWQNGTYAVSGNVTLSGSASVVGTVTLILCDGAKLTVTGCNEGEAAIYVPEGNTLNIYGQKGSSGKLTVTGGDYAAGIGGSDIETFPALSNNCGNINIYGGVINAVGSNGGAGIGGGWGGSAGNVVIYGGTVTAEGDEYYGAGIGAGEEGNCAGAVTFEGGNTHVSGAWAVRCKATVSDDLHVYDFDTDRYAADGWRLGYSGNPSVDALIGSCSFIENGEIKDFSTHFRIYEGQTDFDTGFYYVMQDYTFDSVLTVTGESQFVLADGVTVDARIGKSTGNNLKVFTQSTGEAQGRALGLTAYNEKGKLVAVPEFSIYAGEASLSAGTYYVTESFELDGSLTANGKVNLILADGVTLKLDKLILETGATLTTYTESLSDNKGKIDGYVMSSLKYISADGTFAEMPQDYKFYNGETTLVSGWYFVSDKGCDVCVTVSGTVHLVLGDGTDVLFANGMTVNSGNTLCIYAQSTGDRMGAAEFKADSANAGIGSGPDGTCGTVVINGGKINTHGSFYAAGIGGGSKGNGGSVTVNGGIVTATGGDGAAGIGGGKGVKGWEGIGHSTQAVNTQAGSLTVNGGFVKASGGMDAAGIGGGNFSSGAAVTINGGTVWAYGSNSAAIGPGFHDSSTTGITAGSFFMAEGLVAYCPDAYEWSIGANRNLSYFKDKTAAFIFDGHYYDVQGTRQMMDSSTVAYNGETSLKKNKTYYVRESCTINEPIFVPEGVTLILADGVVMNAVKGLLVTGDSVPTILTQSKGANKGVFTGEFYYCYNNEGESGKFPSGLCMYNGESRLTQGYLVTENVTAAEPILLDGNVSLFLYDGVTFNAAKGYLMTAGSTLTIYTLSQGENKGVFIGEKLTKACEKTLPEYVKLYTGQTSPSAGWYYVRENCTLDEAMILRNDVHFIIPDGVTLDVPKGIYLTESAKIDICTLSAGENAGQITARIFSEYIDAGGSHSIPDNIAVYSKGTTTLNGSYYLVLENSSVDVFSIPNENVTVLIADGVTLKGNAGYFGYEPNVGTFSTGENAGKFVGGALSYLDENGNICLLDSDAHMYNGETVLTDGIWFVGSSKTETGRITVSGDVLLVLGDNTTLKAYRGITVAEGNTLTVTAQSEGESRGKLLAYTFLYGDHEDIDDCDYSAAIGGDEDPEKTMGTVIIRHGYVEAHGFSGGAGIGCEYADDGGTVIISGGTVVAYGNEDGIGIGGDGTTVTVLGGEVFSYGDETGTGGSGFGGENSVLKVLGGKVYACGKHGDCAVLDASVTLGEKMRVADLKTNKIYEDTLFTGSVQSGAKEVLFFDASAVNEKGETVLFPATGQIYNGETVLEKNTWYYVTESDEAEDMLIFRDGAGMVLADGVTLESAKGILCPASGAPVVYSASDSENKGRLVGTLLLPYLDSEGKSYALPDDASLYNGQTELGNEWVYVDENYNLTAPLTVRGNVSIVLADGVTLDAAKGVVIEENGKLNILYVSNSKDKGVFIGTEKGYIDENGTKKNLPDGFAVYNGETVLTNNWYFVTAETVLDKTLEISGDVVLVIADGVTLTANKGILLTDGNSLTVYAQSECENVGSIIAYGDKGAAGIGGDFSVSDAGSFTVNGVNITAVGGVGAAGIGGGLGGNGGTVVVNNGTLTATGGSGAKAVGGGTGAADDGTFAVSESLAVEAGNGAQSITALEYDAQNFVKVTNHGEKYLCGIVGVSDGTAENITVILTDTENSANTITGETDGTNVYYVDNAANGKYIMSVACDGAVTRTYTVEITDGRLVKSTELYVESDVDGNGKIDIYDYQQAVNIALSNENAVPEEGDLSGEADYEIAVADFDCDGYVDVLDVALIERKVYA